MYNPRSSRQSQKKISGKKDRAIEPSGNFLKVLKSKNGYIVDLSNYSLYPSSNTYYKINGNIIREEGKYTLDLEPKPVIELWEVTKAKIFNEINWWNHNGCWDLWWKIWVSKVKT